MPDIFFDVSELFFGSKLKYYGIAKVVCETAFELSRLNRDIRFVIFSPAERRFFAVTPKLGAESEIGIFDPDMSRTSVPIWIRRHAHTSNMLRDMVTSPVQATIRRINRARWKNAPSHVQPVEMNGGILIAMGRPKLMFDYIQDLEQQECDVRFYPLLHDLIPLHDFSGPGAPKRIRKPSRFLLDNIGVIDFATGLIANSEFTKNDLEVFSEEGILPALPRTVAVPLVHEHRQTLERPLMKPPAGPYLLCVGAHTGRKNVEAIFEALCVLETAGKSLPLVVLAGTPRKQIRKLLGHAKYQAIRSAVTFVPDPNQADLQRLYEGALALVIPSRMEGWGLPAGEALWHGSPVIAATAPVLKEVCGDLALYFDPDDAEQLATHIATLMDDEGYRTDLRTRISERRQSLRTWRDFAREVLNAVESAEGLPLSGQADGGAVAGPDC